MRRPGGQFVRFVLARRPGQPDVRRHAPGPRECSDALAIEEERGRVRRDDLEPVFARRGRAEGTVPPDAETICGAGALGPERCDGGARAGIRQHTAVWFLLPALDEQTRAILRGRHRNRHVEHLALRVLLVNDDLCLGVHDLQKIRHWRVIGRERPKGGHGRAGRSEQVVGDAKLFLRAAGEDLVGGVV